jgi:hypothetical protein
LHQAGKSALIQCSYCSIYWHGDCLDPPVTAFPSEIGEETGLIDGDGVKGLKEKTWGETGGDGGGFMSIRRKWMCPVDLPL